MVPCTLTNEGHTSEEFSYLPADDFEKQFLDTSYAEPLVLMNKTNSSLILLGKWIVKAASHPDSDGDVLKKSLAELILNFDFLKAKPVEISIFQRVVTDIVSLKGEMVPSALVSLVDKLCLIEVPHTAESENLLQFSTSLPLQFGKFYFATLADVRQRCRILLQNSGENAQLDSDQFSFVFDILKAHTRTKTLLEHVTSISIAYCSNSKTRRFCLYAGNERVFINHLEPLFAMRDTLDIVYEAVCETIQKIIELFPRCSGDVSELLAQKYPKLRVSVDVQLVYLKGCLCLAKNVSTLRQSILKTVLSNLTAMDLEVKSTNSEYIDPEHFSEWKQRQLHLLAEEVQKGTITSQTVQRILSQKDWFEILYRKVKTDEDVDSMAFRLDILMDYLLMWTQETLNVVQNISVPTHLVLSNSADEDDELSATCGSEDSHILNPSDVVSLTMADVMVADLLGIFRSVILSIDRCRFVQFYFFRVTRIEWAEKFLQILFGTLFDSDALLPLVGLISSYLNSFSSTLFFINEPPYLPVVNHLSKCDLYPIEYFSFQLLVFIQQQLILLLSAWYNFRLYDFFLQRRLCANYIASYVSRATFLPKKFVKTTLTYFIQFLKEFLTFWDQRDHIVDVQPTEASHVLHKLSKGKAYVNPQSRLTLFYAVFQAICYVLCFQGDILRWGLDRLEDTQAANNAQSSTSTDIFDFLIDGPHGSLASIIEGGLSPLIQCHHGIISLFLQCSRRIGIVKGLELIFQQTESLLNKVEPISLDDPTATPFLPFNPYTLWLSSRHLQQCYLTWLTVSKYHLASEELLQLESSILLDTSTRRPQDKYVSDTISEPPCIGIEHIKVDSSKPETQGLPNDHEAPSLLNENSLKTLNSVDSSISGFPPINALASQHVSAVHSEGTNTTQSEQIVDACNKKLVELQAEDDLTQALHPRTRLTPYTTFDVNSLEVKDCRPSSHSSTQENQGVSNHTSNGACFQAEENGSTSKTYGIKNVCFAEPLWTESHLNSLLQTLRCHLDVLSSSSFITLSASSLRDLLLALLQLLTSPGVGHPKTEDSPLFSRTTCAASQSVCSLRQNSYFAYLDSKPPETYWTKDIMISAFGSQLTTPQTNYTQEPAGFFVPNRCSNSLVASTQVDLKSSATKSFCLSRIPLMQLAASKHFTKCSAVTLNLASLNQKENNSKSKTSIKSLDKVEQRPYITTPILDLAEDFSGLCSSPEHFRKKERWPAELISQPVLNKSFSEIKELQPPPKERNFSFRVKAAPFREEQILEELEPFLEWDASGFTVSSTETFSKKAAYNKSKVQYGSRMLELLNSRAYRSSLAKSSQSFNHPDTVRVKPHTKNRKHKKMEGSKKKSYYITQGSRKSKLSCSAGNDSFEDESDHSLFIAQSKQNTVHESRISPLCHKDHNSWSETIKTPQLLEPTSVYHLGGIKKKRHSPSLQHLLNEETNTSRHHKRHRFKTTAS